MIYKPLSAALAVALPFVAWYAYSAGIDTQAGREAIAKQEAIENERDMADEIEKPKAQIEIVYRDRVKFIYRAHDPSGCLDRSLGSVGLLPASADN